MKDKKKSKLGKILKGLFKTEEEELMAYFDSGVDSPDEYSLAAYLFRKYGQKPINKDDTEGIMFECLRELCPDDYTDDMVELRVKEFLDYGFVERWNDGNYW